MSDRQSQQQDDQVEDDRVEPRPHDPRLALLPPEVRLRAIIRLLGLLAHITYYLALKRIAAIRSEEEDWLQELLTGHLERIRVKLGVHRGTFTVLLKAVQELGVQSSRHVPAEEQLSIFLYTVVTGLGPTQVGKRFQRSPGTITKYFKRILQVLATPPFYTTFVRLPDADSPVPPKIRDSPGFSPFFDSALGAVDGTHIPCLASSTNSDASRNHGSAVTRNCVAACTFDHRFIYFSSGSEGSTHDSMPFYDTHQVDSFIPRGRYYLADAGFALSDVMLAPYQNVQRHEWKEHPHNPQELFNIHHASACNVVKQTFGILKRRFRILQLPPQYDMSIQTLIPPALVALHNFIREFDPQEIQMYDNDNDGQLLELEIVPHLKSAGELGMGLVMPHEMARANEKRDKIASDMWEQYP